jgi:hypothetical protein
MARSTVNMRTELLRSRHKFGSKPRNCKLPDTEGEDKRRRYKYFISWLKDGYDKNNVSVSESVIILTWERHEWVEARKPFLYKAEVITK